MATDRHPAVLYIRQHFREVRALMYLADKWDMYTRLVPTVGQIIELHEYSDADIADAMAGLWHTVVHVNELLVAAGKCDTGRGAPCVPDAACQWILFSLMHEAESRLREA